jgi:hypothetical protein
MDPQEYFLSSIRLEDLRSIIRETVQECIAIQEPKITPYEEELLTRMQVAQIYKTSLVSLREWEKQGIIPKPLRKGSRVLFRKSDIMNDIKGNDQNKKK